VKPAPRGPEQWACVDVPALPLQVLLREQPTWREHPSVVVRDDRPQGLVLWGNTFARNLRVLPGMSYAAARSLAPSLRAAVVEGDRIDAVQAELHGALCNFSPRVEPSQSEPGVFWLDPSGLVSLFGSLEQWAEAIGLDLRSRGFNASVAVGFHRYRTYALARTHARGGVWVALDPNTEARLARRVPLVELDLSPRLRDELLVLGVRTLGELLSLPRLELRARFGEEAARLHALASDEWAPLAPRRLVDPVRTQVQLEPPDDDHTRLLFGLKGALHRTMGRLAERGQAMSALHLHLELDHAPPHDERIEPAAPTLDVPMLIDLVRLRLESTRLPAAVETVKIELEGVRATPSQLTLFRTQSRRDLDAGSRALARIRAAFGPAAVTRASLRAAHLPEASFVWEPLGEVRFARVVADDESPMPLVRRLLPRPVPLPPRPRHDDARRGAGAPWLGPHGEVTRMHGPFRVSGGWWVRTVERDYYYAETRHGELLWLYYDRPRRRWFLHGTVD
jgi:protein ImuB